MRTGFPWIGAITVALTACLPAPDAATTDDLRGDVDALTAELAALRGQVGEPAGDSTIEERLTADEARDVALAARLDDDEAVMDDLAARLGALEERADTDADRLDATESDVLAVAAEFDALKADFELLAVTAGARVIGADLVLEVPGKYPDIHAALAAIDDAIIARDAIVTIRIADRVAPYVYTEPIVIDHRDSDNVHIVGNPGDPAKVVLAFVGVSGITVADGNALGRLEGITLDWSTTTSAGCRPPPPKGA